MAENQKLSGENPTHMKEYVLPNKSIPKSPLVTRTKCETRGTEELERAREGIGLNAVALRSAGGATLLP
jgi:hypothetical protein